MTAYRKDFDETKYTSCLLKDDELLEKNIEIWEKVKNILKKELNKVYNEKYLKAKIKFCDEKITNFHNNKIPKEDSQYIFLSVILIDSVLRTGENYYPQVYLEEFETTIKEKKIPNHIIHNVEIYSDSDSENSLENIF